MEAPCRNCEKRELYCHSKCKQYKEFDAFRQRERKRRQAEYADERYFYRDTDSRRQEYLKKRKQRG